MYEEKDGMLTIFNPKCPKCARDMKFYGKRGQGRASMQSDISLTPTITWLQIAYNCPKHPHIGVQLSNEEIFKVNQYPQSRVEFKSAS